MPPVLRAVLIYTLICGHCRHPISSLDEERTASAMLLHLRYAHSDPVLDGRP